MILDALPDQALFFLSLLRPRQHHRKIVARVGIDGGRQISMRIAFTPRNLGQQALESVTLQAPSIWSSKVAAVVVYAPEVNMHFHMTARNLGR